MRFVEGVDGWILIVVSPTLWEIEGLVITGIEGMIWKIV